MIVVTGGAGFIGSNLVKKLNALGRTDIIVVDDLSDGSKIKNINDCQIFDYMDKDDFLALLDDISELDYDEELEEDENGAVTNIEVIFHQGAVSDTTEWDGVYMMETNYEYSKSLYHFCQEQGIPFIYASSAAVYGDGKTFSEAPTNEKPLNMYAYSKWQFDQYMRANFDDNLSQVVGLRYFNVYGPREQHKGKMASVAFHFNNQLLETGKMNLFEGSDGYDDGGQLRDFVFVEDVVEVALWFWQNPDKSGIFNCGTGKAQSFNDVANAVKDYHGKGDIHYIAFPENLKGNYQSYTQADLGALRACGYDQDFHTVEEGVKKYLAWLNR